MTTTTHPAYASLLASVIADPGDDAVRLVMADWLEENGDDLQAEFIRCQIELAKNPPCRLDCVEKLCASKTLGFPCRRCDLRRRERELFANSGPLWWNDLPGSYRTTESADISITTACGMKFLVRRGFVAEVRCLLANWIGGECPQCDGDGGEHHYPHYGPPSRWVKCPTCHGSGRTSGHGRELCRQHPVTAVEFTDRQPYGTTQDFVPSFVWRRLVIGTEDVSPNHLPHLTDHGKFYDTAEQANASLSRAALQWARGGGKR